MAQPKLRSDATPEPAQAAPSLNVHAPFGPPPKISATSPARDLHERLHNLVHADTDEAKWSYRRRVLFILTSASGLWAVLIGGGIGIAHLLA